MTVLNKVNSIVQKNVNQVPEVWSQSSAAEEKSSSSSSVKVTSVSVLPVELRVLQLVWPECKSASWH